MEKKYCKFCGRAYDVNDDLKCENCGWGSFFTLDEVIGILIKKWSGIEE